MISFRAYLTFSALTQAKVTRYFSLLYHYVMLVMDVKRQCPVLIVDHIFWHNSSVIYSRRVILYRRLVMG